MDIDVGALTYRVELVRGYVQHRGEPCVGLCDHLQRRILIADVLDRSQRLHVFLHELMHAWWHVQPGRIDDEEAVADLVATAMTRLLLAVCDDPGALALFDQARGVRGAPLDPPDESDAPPLRVRVRREVVDAPDDDATGSWVVRIFEADASHPAPGPPAGRDG